MSRFVIALITITQIFSLPTVSEFTLLHDHEEMDNSFQRFVTGAGKMLINEFHGWLDGIVHPIDSLKNDIYALRHPNETFMATRHVVNSYCHNNTAGCIGFAAAALADFFVMKDWSGPVKSSASVEQILEIIQNQEGYSLIHETSGWQKETQIRIKHLPTPLQKSLVGNMTSSIDKLRTQCRNNFDFARYILTIPSNQTARFKSSTTFLKNHEARIDSILYSFENATTIDQLREVETKINKLD